MRVRPRLLAVLPVLSLVLVGCGGGDDTSSSSPGAADKGALVVGAANFSENTLLANMYAKVLEKAGYDVTIRSLQSREIFEPALEQGQIDVIPEYVGTLTEFLNKKLNGPTATPVASADLAQTVTGLRGLAERQGLAVFEPSQAADQNAFAVTTKFAADNGLTTLSDLSRYSGPLVLGGPAECPTRPFCQPGLASTYGLKFTGFRALDAGGPLTKRAIADGTVQLGLVFSSDGGIEANDLQVLTDDKGLQTVDNIVPVVNKSKADKPDIRAALDGVSKALTTEELIGLNKQIDVDRANPERVAEDYLQKEGLL